MNAAALLRSKIQATLAPHLRAELEFRPHVPPDVVASGIFELDALVGGGLPRGALTEVCGPTSSGRTSLVYSVLAQMTRKQEACAVVDVSDALDPESLAGAGADLTRILWVRCGGAKAAEQTHAQELQTTKNRSSSIPIKTQNRIGSNSRHPRDSARGLDTAMEFLLQKNIAPENNWRTPLPPKPGVPVNPYGAQCSGGQAPLDRQAPRRADYFLSQHKGLPMQEDVPQVKAVSGNLKAQSPSFPLGRYEKPWPRLEQAVKAVDLLLHGGGFGTVVLDLGSMPWADARRIPLTTWFRFRRAVENTPTLLIVLTESPCAKTCASLVLGCQRKGEEWAHASTLGHPRNRATLGGFDVQVEVLRSRVQASIGLQNGNITGTDRQTLDLRNGKPVQSAHSRSAYSGEELFGSPRSAHWRASTLWTG